MRYRYLFHGRRGDRIAGVIGVASLLLTLLTGCAAPAVAVTQPTAVAPASPAVTAVQSSTPTASAPQPTSTAAPLKPLKAAPESGPVGTAFSISGDGLPAGKTVEFFWATVDGSYKLKPMSDTVEYYDRQFTPKRVSLGRATVDAGGKVTANFTAPEDYGEVHDIFAVVDGTDIARGGFRIIRTAAISATQGKVGDLITITVKGIDYKPYTSTTAVRWDNRYTGFASATTTRGTATFQIRAAGPVGQHFIQLEGGSPAITYLNMPQSPVGNVPQDFTWEYTVTSDASLTPTLQWPDPASVAPVTAATGTTTQDTSLAAGAVSAQMDPASGPVLSESTIQAKGLPPNSDVDLIWITARGNRLSPSGWNLVETPLPKATSGADGTLQAKVQIPNDLGGWHVIKLVQDGKVLAEAPYFVERNLVEVTPQRVKAGEKFTVHINGVGWTELDNGVAVTYDNAMIGYACGFNSNGDISMDLVATGGPGTHLIDLYPMIYQGHGQPPWDYELPQLTALQDGPGLSLGYKLPIFRLSIEVTE